MDKYKQFEESLEKAADIFKTLDKHERIRVVSHLDADGICACSILLKAFNNDNRNYSISIVQQLNEKIIEQLSNEDYKYYFFTDLGSGQIDLINKKLKEKTVFILDHHTPSDINPEKNIVHINPHLQGIDGGVEISGAGVAFLFTNKLNGKKDMAHVAIIGAIGDIQDKEGFKKLNNEILEMAIKENFIETKKGLRLFGTQTRPIHKTLEYCTDPYIPGVSGSESGSIQFLQQLGISPKNEKGWKKMIHLTQEEMKKLVAGVILRRHKEQKPEDVIGDVYLLKKEADESPLKDAKEFATLLNSCGRLNKASIGIGVCLNDSVAKKKALSIVDSYKKEIVKAMGWYEKNKNSEHIITKPGYIIINAEENILTSMAGTIASMLSKSNTIPEKTFILSLARNPIDETTKVSLRISGRNHESNLKEIMNQIISNIPGAESGGHMSASGASIPTEQEEALIKEAADIFERYSMEETVN